MIEIIRYMWNIMKHFFIWFRFMPFIVLLYIPMTLFIFIPIHVTDSSDWDRVQQICLALSVIYGLYQIVYTIIDI